MSAKIKLNAASGGGSFSLQAPSSSANTRVMTLPDTADGTILTTTNPRSGNTVQTVTANSHTRLDTTSTSYVASSHSITITPIFANSKILVNFTLLFNTGGTNHRGFLDVYRSINGGTFAGIAPVGSNETIGASNGSGFFSQIRGDSSRIQVPTHIHYLDTPSYSLGNAIIYKLYARSNNSGQTIEIPSGSNAEPVVMMLTEIAA
tara:strand:+ start:124 stop:738 length:615 start_codon:yes stop_codon:yes gene_type:complete